MAKTNRVETRNQQSLVKKETGARQNTNVTHPKYIDMIKDAIANLKQPRGTPTRNILNFICANYKLENRIAVSQSVNIALKMGVKNGSLNAVGRNADKYVLADEEKITVKKPCLKKHSQAHSSSSTSEEKVNEADMPNLKNVKLGMSSSIYPHKPSTSTLLRVEPSGPGLTFSYGQSSSSSPFPSFENMKVRHKDRLKIKTPGDLVDCCITALALTQDGRILLTDYGNNNIKLFNKDGQHLASLAVENSPSDISTMSNVVAVVAFSTEAPLVCLNIKDCIEIEKSIKDTSKSMFISCCQNRIAAVFWEETKSVKLIDINGHIIWSRSLSDKGRALFNIPFYTTMYQDKGKLKIIIYDSLLVAKENKLIILNKEDGSIIELMELSWPGEAGVINGPGGSPYICYYQMSDTKIHTWDSHYRSSQVLITEDQKLGPNPRYIKYCEPSNEIIVGYSLLSESKNYIDTFTVFS